MHEVLFSHIRGDSDFGLPARILTFRKLQRFDQPVKRMSCPDEDTFARMQAGLLSSNELADFHRHLDQCVACFELAGVLAGAYDGGVRQNGVGEDDIVASANPLPDHRALPGVALPQSQSRRAQVAACAMTLAHAYFSLSIMPVFWGSSAPPESGLIVGKFGLFAPIVTIYVIFWGFVGFAWACAGCWALLTNRRWAVLAGRSYAILSIPTIILSPLGLCLLLALQHRRNGVTISH